AQVIPARACPLGHRVGLAPGLVRVTDPLPGFAQRRLGLPGRLEVVELREPDRQFRNGDRIDAILFVQYDRERLAPVALAGEEPIAQLVSDGLLTEPFLLEPVRDRALGFGRRQAIERNLRVP